MGKKEQNQFELTDEYGICYVKDGEKFIFDTEDYSRISQHHWWKQNNNFYSHINGTTVSIANFIMGDYHPQYRVLKKDNSIQDYRKSNLYSGNEYQDCGEYYLGSTYCGKSFKIDKDDYDLCKKYRWYIDKNGYVLGYPIGTSKEYAVKQHRLVMGVAEKSLDVEVDHVKHDQLDNRKSQLRIVTRSQNCQNKRKGKNNKSGHKGVYQSYYNGKCYWHAQINHNGTRHYLGSFSDYDSAVKARELAEQEYHGVYTCK